MILKSSRDEHRWQLPNYKNVYCHWALYLKSFKKWKTFVAPLSHIDTVLLNSDLFTSSIEALTYFSKCSYNVTRYNTYPTSLPDHSLKSLTLFLQHQHQLKKKRMPTELEEINSQLQFHRLKSSFFSCFLKFTWRNF